MSGLQIPFIIQAGGPLSFLQSVYQSLLVTVCIDLGTMSITSTGQHIDSVVYDITFSLLY